MPFNLPSALLFTAIAAAILPPGYPAYIGAYVALLASIATLVLYGWRQRQTVLHPTALAIIASILLLSAALPFVYRTGQDLLAPILVLPMLSTIALGMLARPARWVPTPTVFAAICLLAVFIAMLGGGYERLVLDITRPGLGNNPIHYASLASVAGALALVGVVSGSSRWRYLFLLGPGFALVCTAIADSRGPMLGAVALTAAGFVLLTIWLWQDRVFRFAVLLSVAAAAVGVFYLVGSGNARVAGVLDSALNIFRFTGGPDDIRAALYASAVEILRKSPIVGVGLGQIMDTVRVLYPEQREALSLENLHADWANFAAMAGGLGLLAWMLLLVAPLLLLRDARARQDRVVVLGATLLCVGQFTLGVSNATFGILPQTTIYAVAMGYFFVRARRLAMDDIPTA